MKKEAVIVVEGLIFFLYKILPEELLFYEIS